MKRLLFLSLVLCSCSALHPSLNKPDAEFVVNGCKYYGFRDGSKGRVVHAGDCPNPIHLKMHPDTIYTHQTLTKE